MKNPLAYMASILGVAMQGLEPQQTKRKREPKIRKCDQKKCKSCKHFEKGSWDAHCTIKGYVNPLDSACSKYQKRKR